MNDALKVLEARVRLLEDRWTLQQMFAAMGPAMDAGGGAEVAAFFEEQGGYETDVPGAPPAVGRAQLAGLYDSDMHNQAIEAGAGHLTAAPHIVIDGDRAEVYCHTVLFRRIEGAWMVARVASNRFWCARDGEGWRITYRVNRMLGSAEARALFKGGACDLHWAKAPLTQPRRKAFS